MKKFTVTGMTCAACAARVEKAVKGVNGVEQCAVNLLTNTLTVEGEVNDANIITAIRKAGYDVNSKDKTDKVRNEETKKLIMRLISSIIFSLALMYVSMGINMFNFPFFFSPEKYPLVLALIQLIFATIIMIINNKFFINGVKGAIHLSPNMDTLVSLGSFTSYVYSLVIVFIMATEINNTQLAASYLHRLFFDSSGMILTLITVGKTLESYSKGKTTNAIKSLMDLTPKTALILKDGKEVIVNVDEVKVGDKFIVKPGDAIPVDGIILEGNSSLDESMISGEPLPKDKTIGDKVISATINHDGYLICEAQKVGNDTTISQIIKMVNDANATKAPISKIADKVSGVFVPVVISIALITFIIWLSLGKDITYSLNRAISILVISCPCALGLATPVAIMVGSGKGARNGILYKNATVLEEAGKSKIIVLDKTGTITKGEMVVSNVLQLDPKLLEVVYALENKSEHPLGKACTTYCKENNVPLVNIDDFKILPGKGVEGRMNNNLLIGAKYDYIKEYVSISDDVLLQVENETKIGKTPLFFAENGILLGVLFISDTVKDDSKEVICELKKMGLKTIMLTGDNHNSASYIGELIGVDEVISNVLPDEKENVIKKLMKDNKVIMVGDGINDSIALSRADIGIAMSRGSDIAIESANIVVVSSSLMSVVNAIKISRSTLRVIYENLFWAFIYNVIGIPLAAGAFTFLFHFELTPMFGALAMSLSSICVVLNALRLNIIKINKASLPTNEASATSIELKEVNMKKKMKIKGMMCKHCENRVKKALEKHDAVIQAIVDYENGLATVELSYPVEDQVLKAIVEAEDYEVLGIE